MEELRSEICRREKIIQDKLCKFKGSNVQKGFLEGGLYEIQDLKEIYFKIQNLQMIEENENKAMKKHKVPIPSGYEVESVSPCTEDAGLNMISTTVVFQKIKKELPKTWEEYCEITEPFKADYNDQMTALRRLIELRDYYNRSQPAKSSHQSSIYKDEVGDLVFEEVVCSRGPLTFHFKSIGLEFWDNFRELLETAKPLL